MAMFASYTFILTTRAAGQPASIHSVSNFNGQRASRPIRTGAGIFPASANRHTVRGEQVSSAATASTSSSSGGLI
jgi:hypothetical protein